MAGAGYVGRCQITVAAGEFAKYGISSLPENLTPIGDRETRFRDLKPLAADRRLGCSALILGDLVVEIPSDAQTNRQVVRKRAENRAIERDLVTHLCFGDVAPPDISAPEGDVDRLMAMLEKEWGYQSPVLMRRCCRRFNRSCARATAGHGGGVPGSRRLPVVTGLWPGLKETIYGLTVDIGSTTIAAHLCDLMTGRVVGSAGALNPQIRFGEDLMSRISYIPNEPGQPAGDDGRRARGGRWLDCEDGGGGRDHGG